MRMFALAKRNTKEILRDPINLIFGLGFPLVLLALLSIIQANIPVSMFEPQHLTPGITIFGLSFITLFNATIIAKDRGTSLLARLYTTPLTPADFILAYALPMVPFSVAQSAICYVAAFAFGLVPTIHVLSAILFIIPISLLYIGLGLLFGSILNDKQVGGICGGLLTNLSAWLSGIWFDLNLLGGALKHISYALPFVHAVEAEKALCNGNFELAFLHLLPVLLFSTFVTVGAVLCFFAQMKKQ